MTIAIPIATIIVMLFQEFTLLLEAVSSTDLSLNLSMLCKALKPKLGISDTKSVFSAGNTAIIFLLLFLSSFLRCFVYNKLKYAWL